MPRSAQLATATIAAIVSLSAPSSAQNFGIERWGVKTLEDSLANRIDFKHPIRSSVRIQTQLQPFRPKKGNPRMDRVEMKFYSIKAWFKGVVLEADSDYHIVIRDISTDSTMVIEIPDPDRTDVAKTPWAAKYRIARDWVSANVFTPTGTFKPLPKPIKVRITGVGYYDRMHGQRGMAANGREIHPVMSIDFAK